MWKSSIIVLLLSLIIWPLRMPVRAETDFRWDLEIRESYQVKENYLQRDNLELIDDLHFVKDRAYNLVHLQPTLTIATDKGVYGYLGADFCWQSPVEEYEGDDVEADLVAAYLSIKGDKVSTDLGLQPVQFGEGFILADDSLAAALQVDLGSSYAALKAANVLDNSPMVGLTLGYRPGHFERFELFGIWFSDRDDTFANSMPFIYQVLLDLTSEGDLYYFGVAAELFLGDSLLSFVGAYQTGRYTIAYRTGGQLIDNEADVQAFFGDISLQKNLTDWCTAELFCHVASGDEKAQDRNVDAFVSITPYNPRAAIFFDPDFMGLNDSYRVTYSGGFFGGVVAPGLRFTLASNRGLTAEIALIYLYAHQDLDDGSRWYGWEADLDISYLIDNKYRLFVEAARFEHGDYFESLLDERMDPAIRLIIGLSATF